MKKFGIRSLLATVTMLGFAQPALAQEEIDVEPYDAYFIEDKGLSFPTTLAGSVRESVYRYEEGDYNISATYRRRDNGDVITVYYYRLSGGSVPVWFDRVSTVIEGHGQLGMVTEVHDFDPMAGSETRGAAMGRVWTLEGNFQSTGLVLAKKGDMLVKLRISSKELPPSAMADFLSEVTTELGVELDNVPYAQVQDCAAPMRPFDKKIAAVDSGEDQLANSLISAVLGSMVEEVRKESDDADGEEEASGSTMTTYCREDGINGVYRPVDTTDAYFLALQDSGLSISVGPATLLEILRDEDDDEEQLPIYRATVHQTTKNLIFPEMDGFPSPQDAIEFLQSNNPSSVVNTAGESKGNVEINM